MSWRRIVGTALAAAALIAAAALAVGACGSDDSDSEAAEQACGGSDLTAVCCPMEKTGQVDGVDRYEPAEDAFDTAELVGVTLNDARNKAAEHGCEIVVSVEDGEGIPVPLDIDPARIYVYVENDEVTYVEGVGGGL